MTWRDELAALILSRTGVEVPRASPQLAVVTRERVEVLGLSRPDRYLRHLAQLPTDHTEWHRLIQAVTNHLTHFFRDPEQLSCLTRVMETLARQRSLDEPLRVWSAGCATGEEVYTLAIIAHQHGLRLRLCGSDVSRQALEVAERGVYDAWSLRHVAPDIKETCFSKVDAKAYRIRPEIARMVHFREHNLVRSPPLSRRGRKWDIIICRNVLIYYSPDVVKEILTGFTQSLVNDGALLLGASESILRLALPLRVEVINNRVVYYLKRANQTAECDATAADSARNDATGVISGVCPPPLKQTSDPSALIPTSYIEIQSDLLTLLTEGDLKGAEHLLKKVAADNSADSLASLSLGHIYLLEHDFERARQRYQDVTRRDPLVAEAHYFLGVVERRCQRLDEAFAALRRAVFLEPHFWAASYLLGATAQRLGRHSVRRTEWQRTLSLLKQGRGELPLLTHPLLHARFLEAPERVMQVCRSVP